MDNKYNNFAVSLFLLHWLLGPPQRKIHKFLSIPRSCTVRSFHRQWTKPTVPEFWESTSSENIRDALTQTVHECVSQFYFKCPNKTPQMSLNTWANCHTKHYNLEINKKDDTRRNYAEEKVSLKKAIYMAHSKTSYIYSQQIGDSRRKWVGKCEYKVTVLDYFRSYFIWSCCKGKNLFKVLVVWCWIIGGHDLWRETA